MARPRKSTVDNKYLLDAALEGLELQKSRIEEQIAEVRRMLGMRNAKPAKAVSEESTPAAAPASKKRALSLAARKRIAVAQKKRWAAYRKTTPKPE